MYYKIKEVADLVGISVRMLRHYDKIGLLKPRSINEAGYRLYTDKELERLQQILFFKELDFSLQQIKSIIDNPDFDKLEALQVQKQILIEKGSRIEKIIRAVDKTINTLEGGPIMDKKEMFEAFDMTEIENYKEKYKEEVKLKYGKTDAYRESQIKTSGYSKDDWMRIQAESNKIFCKIAEMMDLGAEAPEVQQAVDEWREHITRYFYKCNPEILRGLGEMYINDARFTANIDKHKSGLASFLREAIIIYCDNLDK